MKALALPPTNLLLLMLFGWLIGKRLKVTGRTIVIVSSLALYLLSIRAVAGWLMQSLQTYPPLAPSAAVEKDAGAIVVLSAGVRRAANEYNVDRIGPLTFERLRYGAHLHRRFNLPLLLSGGLSPRMSTSRAELMSEALNKEFGLTPRWLEGNSGNTRENAAKTAEVLSGEGISRIYLVTHAWHMPRAKASFERAGLDVIPAPTAFYAARQRYSVVDFIPSARGLNVSAFVVHEYLGALWYKVSGN